MYQIKFNDYLEIISDDCLINTKSYFEFINNADKINYIKDKGFVLEYQNKEYFIKLNKYDLILFKSKHYEMMPYYYQKLIFNYHLKNEIIETNHEKREYLNELYLNKPKFKNILIKNYIKQIEKNINDKNIILLILSGFVFFNILFKSIKEYKNSMKEMENKIKKIKELKVYEFAFEKYGNIDINVYLNEMFKHKDNSHCNNNHELYKDNIIEFDKVKKLVKKR